MKRYDDYLVVTDLDGTLYANQNDIPRVNLDSVKRFAELGGKFAVATGRGLEATRFITNSIDISAPIIINNGHAIYDYHTERFVYSINLPEQIKSFTLTAMQQYKTTGVEIYTDKKVYVLRENDIIKRHLSYESIDYDIISFETASAMPWSKLLIADSTDMIDRLRLFADSYQSSEFDMVRTSTHYFEGFCAGINKGTAVQKLAESLGIAHNRVYTIGNYYNDIELIQAGYIGAAVADSPQEVRSAADYVTQKTCDEGAFTEFLNYIMQQ